MQSGQFPGTYWPAQLVRMMTSNRIQAELADTIHVEQPELLHRWQQLLDAVSGRERDLMGEGDVHARDILALE